MISVLQIVGFLICCSSFLAAKEQHLVYDGDAYIYELTFDDSRTSVADMQQIWWLSPWVGEPPIGPFNMGFSEWKSPLGDDMVDKVFMAPNLELCSATPQAITDSSKFSSFAPFLR